VFRKLTTKSEAVNVSKVLYKHFYMKFLHGSDGHHQARMCGEHVEF
jgi:hypothetical protein